MTTLNTAAVALTNRIAISTGLAASGVIHAYLFVHGYRFIPTIGTAFLVQASVFCALAVLIVAGAPRWATWAAGLLALGSLVAFALSRTSGLFGFAEAGWQPSPYAGLSVVAEILTAVVVVTSESRIGRSSHLRQREGTHQ
jgi:hypothetical protein